MASKHLTFLDNVLFTLKHSFRMFPVDEFHIYRFIGAGCIPSKWWSMKTVNIKTIYINSGMLANSDYGFCKTLIRDFIRNPRYFDIVISAVLF